MTALLRNILLAAVAVSALGGSALADQTIASCAKTSTDSIWGRCCNMSGSDCLGGGNGGRDHGGHDNGGRGTNGGAAGKN